MSNGSLNFNNTKYISETEHIELSKRCHPQKGDLLLSKVGTTGIPLIVETEKEFSIFVSLALIKFTSISIDKRFLIHLINSPLVQEQVQENTRGVGNKNWVLTAIANTLILLPPLNEQLRISDKIDELTPIINQYAMSQQRLENLNRGVSGLLKKSILQEAIQGKLVSQIETEGTAQELLEQIRQEKQNLIKEGKLKKSASTNSIIYKGDDNKYYEQIGKELIDITEQIPFDIPDSWNWVRGRFIFLPMESIKPTSDFIYIDVDAVNNRTNVIDNPKTIRAGHAPSRATRKLHKYDVLFSMVRPYLKNIVLVDSTYKEAIASTGFYVITPSIGLYPKFLFNLMLSSYVVDGLNSFIKGDNSPSINNCHIENFLYPLPPIKEQQRIVAQIEKLFEQLH